MKKQGSGFWREMYIAAKQGSVDFLRLQLLSLEKENASEIFLTQLKKLIKLALIKKREQEEKLAVFYHRKQLRGLICNENQQRARALAANSAMIYASPCVFWQ